jgi:hypothetical protein
MAFRKIEVINRVVVKGAILLMLSVYLLFSVGILKATHFCMGREASVVYFSAEAVKCPCELYAEEKGDYCNDEHEILRIKDEQKVISKMSLPLPVWKLERIYTKQFIVQSDLFDNVPLDSDDSSLPPKIPLWKANCSLVFYDDDLRLA